MGLTALLGRVCEGGIAALILLAWGRVVHLEKRSFFRAEKALPIAFVRPRGGGGMYSREEAEDKFLWVAELLRAEVLGGLEELREYTEEEASRW